MRVLVAPLDWGLGHATRCIPLVEELISRYNAQITFAAGGSQRALLEEAFPGIPFVKPPENRIKYHKNRAVTISRIALLAPKFYRIIRQEKRWLGELAGKMEFDMVISDNRYGMTLPGKPCYFITHQLNIRTSLGKLADRLAQAMAYRQIRSFTECWVPDFPTEPSLAGNLSHPDRLPPTPVRYIGPLSRLKKIDPTADLQLLVILSGPEPQRTILENIILRQWKNAPGISMVLVRGLPGNPSPLPAPDRAIVLNHADTPALSQLVANARLILCRSGYSSIMDLLPLRKKCIMVPTPGQPEQEYLARLHASSGTIVAISQDALQLEAFIK